jgi:hypothetical protein
MKHRYKIRTHESGNQDGSTETGTLVLHIGGSSPIDAQSIDEVEAAIRKNIASKTIPSGRVYQICPPPETSESLRSLAVALDGSFHQCTLEPAKGLYSEFRKIKLADSLTPVAA